MTEGIAGYRLPDPPPTNSDTYPPVFEWRHPNMGNCPLCAVSLDVWRPKAGERPVHYPPSYTAWQCSMCCGTWAQPPKDQVQGVSSIREFEVADLRTELRSIKSMVMKILVIVSMTLGLLASHLLARLF